MANKKWVMGVVLVLVTVLACAQARQYDDEKDFKARQTHEYTVGHS